MFALYGTKAVNLACIDRAYMTLMTSLRKIPLVSLV